jgi:hypothetical protein
MASRSRRGGGSPTHRHPFDETLYGLEDTAEITPGDMTSTARTSVTGPESRMSPQTG